MPVSSLEIKLICLILYFPQQCCLPSSCFFLLCFYKPVVNKCVCAGCSVQYVCESVCGDRMGVLISDGW